MEREKPSFDILGRIEQERLARGWSEYTLAENSGLTQSTISTWRRRNLQTSVASDSASLWRNFFRRTPELAFLPNKPNFFHFGGIFLPTSALLSSSCCVLCQTNNFTATKKRFTA